MIVQIYNAACKRLQAWTDALLLPTPAPFLATTALSLRQRVMQAESASATWQVIVLLLVTIAAYHHLRMLIAWIPQTPYDFDGIHTYLPLAKEFRESGWRFLLAEKAAWVPPFSYIFPALFNGDASTMRGVNIGLSVACVFIAFRIGWLTHSRLVGLFAAFFYGASPHFWPYNPTVSVEALTVFLFMASFWALAEAQAGARGAFFLAGGLLALAAMTRATILYFLPGVLVISLILLWWQRKQVGKAPSQEQERFLCGLRLASGVALVLIAPLIIKNIALWGVAAVSTGSGVALLNGHHPVTWGFEANYFNTAADHYAAAAPGLSHLDVNANASMSAIGKMLIGELPLLTLLQMYGYKLLAFLFVTNREWVMPVENLREWRVGLLALSLFSLLAWRRPMVLFLWLFVLFQVAIHLPALYLHRYSVPALDIPLALLGAVGLGVLLLQARLWLAGGALAACATLVAASGLTTQNAAWPTANVDGVQHRTLVAYRGAEVPVKVIGGFELVDGKYQQVELEGRLEIDLSAVTELSRARPILLDIALRVAPTPVSRSCENVRLWYRATNVAEYSNQRLWYQRWPLSQGSVRLVFGGTHHIRLNEPGFLMLQFECKGAGIAIESFAMHQPLVLRDLRERYWRDAEVTSWDEWYVRRRQGQ